MLYNYYTTYTEFVHNISIHYVTYEIIFHNIWFHFNTKDGHMFLFFCLYVVQLFFICCLYYIFSCFTTFILLTQHFCDTTRVNISTGVTVPVTVTLFASRPVFEVNSLGVYPLRPRRSSCGPTKGSPPHGDTLRVN